MAVDDGTDAWSLAGKVLLGVLFFYFSFFFSSHSWLGKKELPQHTSRREGAIAYTFRGGTSNHTSACEDRRSYRANM
ncbi:hypothetical protein AUEXF2481DRAFT_421835 [Aureobasidium subglaciale EXF-2481]|uniref:Uncharacterized protein n=1 Tax=Aureobasidium subglaciale (strain EXF-2481) TaxID=1043005 RepID=A0A074Y479_AURSE|nr:uncharacterized protein AUEXF2481DRAFT_421835 [Aureobasidium subglaciale EXF-2481]KEQ92520.1 hypothetical protein AUEXF2481DRAFT_421835 [Aureobasidium subglaciale EXF-2481]